MCQLRVMLLQPVLVQFFDGFSHSPVQGLAALYEEAVVGDILNDGVLELSLSRLNHWLPRAQAHPEVMQGTADLHHHIADALLPEADPIFHHATALHATVDMLDAEPTLVQGLVRLLLLQGQLRTAWLLHRHENLHLRECERQEAQILQQPTPSRERVGGGLSDAQIMDTAAVGVAQKEDDEERIDEQDIFDGVIAFLAAITRLLFSSILGADDAPLRPVMGKRGGRAQWLVWWQRVWLPPPAA